MPASNKSAFQREWFDPKFIELAEVCADGLLNKSQIIDRYLDTIGEKTNI